MISKLITLTKGAWVDVNHELGVSKNQTIYIQNRSQGSAYLWLNDGIAPTTDSGVHLRLGDDKTFTTDGESIHAAGVGTIYAAVLTGATSVSLEITENTRLPVTQITTLSANNSTTVNLAANSVFTGLGDDVSGFGTIIVSVFSSHHSAGGGLEFQASNDNVEWYTIKSYTHNAASAVSHTLAPVFRYFRVRFTNSNAATTSFIIQTYYKQGPVSASIDVHEQQLGSLANIETKIDTTNTEVSIIKDKLPSLVGGRSPVDASGVNLTVTDTLNGTREYDFDAGTRESFTASSSTIALQLPQLGPRREARIISSARCFVKFGGSGVAPATLAAGNAIFPADCPETVRIRAGATHYRVIGELTGGSISISPVV